MMEGETFNQDGDRFSSSPALSKFIREMNITEHFRIVVDNPRPRVWNPSSPGHPHGKSGASDKRSLRWLADGETHTVLEDQTSPSLGNNNPNLKAEPSDHISNGYCTSDQIRLPRLPRRQVSDTSLDSTSTLSSKKKYKDSMKAAKASAAFPPLPKKKQANTLGTLGSQEPIPQCG